MATHEVTATNTRIATQDRGGVLWPGKQRVTRQVASHRLLEVTGSTVLANVVVDGQAVASGTRRGDTDGSAPTADGTPTGDDATVESAVTIEDGDTAESLADRHTADELRAAATRAGVPTSGSKTEIAERLLADDEE